MKAFRIIAIAGALAMFASTTGPAFAELNGTVKGSGFYRTTEREGGHEHKGHGKGRGKKKGHGKHKHDEGMSQVTETWVTVAGVDDSDGDYGRASVVEHKPNGAQQTQLAVEIDCVSVDENTAYLSGLDANEDRHYLVIEDKGQSPRRDEFGHTANDTLERSLMYEIGLNCGAGETLEDGEIPTRPIDGGNFTVDAG